MRLPAQGELAETRLVVNPTDCPRKLPRANQKAVRSDLRTLAMTIAIAASACSPGTGRDRAPSGAAPATAATLLSGVTKVLHEINPAIENIRILDLIHLERRSADYLVLAHGYANRLGDPPNWDNELFLAVAFDETLTEVVGVFARLPARNWRGWNMWIDEVRRDTIVFARQSRTYGGDPVLTPLPLAGSIIDLLPLPSAR